MKLILHFDINKTIIIADKTANKEEEDIINEILSQHIFGFVKELETYEWIPISKEPTIYPPKEDLISYNNFIDKFLYPYPKDPNLSPRERMKIHKEINIKSGLEKTSFTDKNKPGHMYRSFYDQMVSKIKLENGKFEFLLPCFLELILYLKETGIDYEIVFRTFGSDYKEIKKAFNEFCNGKDPKYKGIFFNGENGSKDLRIKQCNSIYRNGDSIEDCYMILDCENGYEKIDKNLKKKDLEKMFPEKKILKGHEIYEYIVNAKGSIYIRDFYFWWNFNHRNPRSGKLFIIDNSSDILQMFFDDNVIINNSMEEGIIDQRDIHSGEFIHTSKTIGMNIHQVYPLLSISNEKYMIELIKEGIRKSGK